MCGAGFHVAATFVGEEIGKFYGGKAVLQVQVALEAYLGTQQKKCRRSCRERGPQTEVAESVLLAGDHGLALGARAVEAIRGYDDVGHHGDDVAQGVAAGALRDKPHDRGQ